MRKGKIVKKKKKLDTGGLVQYQQPNIGPTQGASEQRLQQGAGAVPVWGQLAQATMKVSSSIKGDRTNGTKNAFANSFDPASGIAQSVDAKDYKGAAITAINPIGGGFIQAKREKKEQARKREEYNRAFQTTQAASLMENAANFKDGGQILANRLGVQEGGSLSPISDNAVEVKANNPNQTDSVELDSAFVDHNEIIDKKNRVFSDEVKLPNGKTIAKEAKRLEKMKNDSFRFKSSNSRLDHKLDNLFIYQESVKGYKSDNNFKRFAKGGKVGGGSTPTKPEDKEANNLNMTSDQMAQVRRVGFTKGWDSLPNQPEGTIGIRRSDGFGKYFNSTSPNPNNAVSSYSMQDREAFGDLPHVGARRSVGDFLRNNSSVNNLKYGDVDYSRVPGFANPNSSIVGGIYEMNLANKSPKETGFKNYDFSSVSNPSITSRLDPDKPITKRTPTDWSKLGFESKTGEGYRYSKNKPAIGSLTNKARKAGGGNLFSEADLQGTGSLAGSTPITLDNKNQYTGSVWDNQGVQSSSQTGSKFNWAGAANTAATYAPNIVNAFLQKKLKGPYAPMKEGRTRLSKFNADGQLAESARDYGTARALVAKGTTQSSDLAAATGSLLARRLNNNNQIYGNLNNLNNQVQNQEAQMNASVQARNVDRTNDYNNNVVDFQNKKLQMTSENIANASSKFQANNREKNQMAKDKQAYEFLKAGYGDSQVLERLQQEHPDWFTNFETKKKNKMGGKLNKLYKKNC